MKTVETGYKISGTNAERLAISAGSLGQQEITFYETDTNSEYEWKGSEWVLTKVNGAASVTTTGASGAMKDRIQTLSAVTTRQRMTWAAGTGPKHIILAVNHADFCKVTFNAASTGSADASLAETYDGSFNLTHAKFNNASSVEEREFVFSTPLETLDFLPTTNHTEFKVIGI